MTDSNLRVYFVFRGRDFVAFVGVMWSWDVLSMREMDFLYCVEKDSMPLRFGRAN